MSTTDTKRHDRVADRLAQLDAARAAKDTALNELQAENYAGHEKLWTAYRDGLHELSDQTDAKRDAILADYDRRTHEIQPEKAPRETEPGE